MRITKKYFLSAVLALSAVVSSAHAEHYVMVHHGQGMDPFWPVVERGARDGAKAIGAQFESLFAPSGDMADMARLIESAAANQPDGLIISLPDVDALGPIIKSAADSGIPIITINSGLDHYKKVGALLHIGQPEREAGRAAGERARREGKVTKALCLIHEAYNKPMMERCEGYFEGLGQPLNTIETTNDLAQIKTRTAGALQADPSINAVFAISPNPCEGADAAIQELGADVHLSCIDMTAKVIDLIKAGRVAYTIDQQPYLQGYLPITFLHLYNTNARQLPGSNVLSGPGFVDRSNASAVQALAGETR